MAVALFDQPLQQRRAGEVEHDQHRHHQQRDPGQGGADDVKHHQKHHTEEQVQPHPKHLLHQKLTDGVKLIHVVENGAHLAPLEIRQWQSQ